MYLRAGDMRGLFQLSLRCASLFQAPHLHACVMLANGVQHAGTVSGKPSPAHERCTGFRAFLITCIQRLWRRQAVKDGALTFVAVPAFGKMGLPVILLFPCRFAPVRSCRTCPPPIHRFPEHRHPFGNAHFPGLHCAPLYAPPPSLPAVRLTLNWKPATSARNVQKTLHVTLKIGPKCS